MAPFSFLASSSSSTGTGAILELCGNARTAVFEGEAGAEPLWCAIIRFISNSFASWYASSDSKTSSLRSIARCASSGCAFWSCFLPLTNDTNSTARARFTAKKAPRMIIRTK